ncbi:MAG: sigma-E processing peptidase SpoIIGA [Candidatus Coproplasma sp.]
MTVYIELSLAENFCMDFCLLFAAKAVTKNPAGYFRVALASALGACFAVAFPLFNLNGALAITVKIAAGAALCAVAGRFSRVSGYLKFTAVFFVITFLTGGALLGIFSLADISYVQGGGMIISSVPVGIPVFCALALALAARSLAKKYSRPHTKTCVICRISVGQSCVSAPAFYDSGNRVFYRGSPVSVIPQSVAKKLTDISRIKTFTEIHTVAGSKKIAVFTADKIEIDDGKVTKTFTGAKLGVSPDRISRAVLHPDLAEAN